MEIVSRVDSLPELSNSVILETLEKYKFVVCLIRPQCAKC